MHLEKGSGKVTKKYTITLDGPAGAGKSTVAKELAKKLSYIYLDTGALYRAIAYKVIQESVSSENPDQFQTFCNQLRIRLVNVDGNMKVLVDDEDVTDKIRTEKVGILASRISAVRIVREILLPVQREAGRSGGIIAEGRDMGTVIFPDADFKFFLEADVEERVRRRYEELKMRGDPITYDEVKRDLILRDRQDRERQIAPLIPSDDAVVIDCTHMAVDEVVDHVMTRVRS